MNDDTFERDVDDSHFMYSTIPELILLLKQLRLNDPAVKQVCIQWRKLPTAYINTFFSLLAENTFVTHVKISQCNITDEVGGSLAHFIRYNRTVIDLDLSRNSLSDASARDIADSLLMQTSTLPRQTLRKLTLQGNNFTDFGVAMICTVICSTNVQVLKIGKMSLSEVGAVGVAEMLMHTSCPIRKLDLRSCSLGSNGASIVGKALAVNKSLEMLCLGKNNVGDEAMRNLADALENNESLRTLDVQYNPITDVGANYFARCLDDSNYTLRKLKLRHCDSISNEVKETLLDTLMMNSYGPELAFKTKDALRSVLVEESSNSSTSMFDASQNRGYQVSTCESSKLPLSLSTSSSNETCVICFENQAECILLPCRHRNCCTICAHKLKSCHMCREVIVKVFQPISFDIANSACTITVT